MQRLLTSEDALTDFLIATQCPPSYDDREALTEFHHMWAEILRGSREEIDAFIQSDLESAKQEGEYEKVVALYASEHHP